MNEIGPIGEDSPFVRKMGAILKEREKEGYKGIRLFVSDNRDASVEDVARSFCAIALAKVKNTYDDANPLPF